MNGIIEMILNNLLPIFGSVLATVLSYIGMNLKKAIEEEMKKKKRNEIVDSTVNYVEQITKNTTMTSSEKFTEAKTKILEWLHDEKINVNDTKLDILIENAVKRLT